MRVLYTTAWDRTPDMVPRIPSYARYKHRRRRGRGTLYLFEIGKREQPIVIRYGED